MKHKTKGNRKDGKVTGRVVKENGGTRGNSRYDGRRVWLAMNMEFLTSAHIGMFLAADDEQRKELAKLGIPYAGFEPILIDRQADSADAVILGLSDPIPQEAQNAVQAAPNG